jgi:hypothetical protein
MKEMIRTGLLGLVFFTVAAYGQVSPKLVNGARNSAADGTTLDTNVSFSLRMTLAGDGILRDTALIGQAVDIRAVIHPEIGDIGKPADIVLVDFLPPVPYMRNVDGNFVAWNGNPSDLVPSQESVILTDGMDVDVFSGQLGSVGLHRIYVGYLVDGALYFTPSALKISVQDAPAPTPREQAMALFDTTISPNIVQRRCIVCHVSGGLADNRSSPVFARISYADHLNYNFGELEWLKSFRSSNYILNKVLGYGHEGGIQLFQGSSDYNSLVEFLNLLDQIAP